MDIKLHVKVTLDTSEAFFGPGPCRLLELIERTGSLKAACTEMDLSYTKGYKLIKRIEKVMGTPIVERHTGGRDGGGSALTDEGRKLITNYRALESGVEDYSNKLYERIFV